LAPKLGEFELIRTLFAPLATTKGALALSDDAAFVAAPAGSELVVTTDAVVSGVHFLPDDPPDTVAQKALRVNLSDLAAKGARPAGYLLTLALPEKTSRRWLVAFARGLRRDQKTFGIPLLGGDTTRTPGALTIAIAALGFVPKGRMIRRGGAKPGDIVFVTGTIGDAGEGLALARSKARSADARALIARYRTPTPRTAFGPQLRGLASASVDVSDGLLADLGHVADVSGARIALDADRIPLSAALRRVRGASEAAIIRAATAGDDYEIAFTCSPSARARVLAVARAARVKLTEIGTVSRGKGVALLGPNGRPLPVARTGYTHF
jgi:thiamine-monophosphate kinase